MDKQSQPTEGIERMFAGLPFFSGLSGFNGQAMRMAVWPMEVWFQWQADMLKTAAPIAADWMARRREGVEAVLRALERLGGCQDVKEISRIQSEWIEDETRRLESDARAFGNPALLWPREVAKASRPAAPAERATERAAR